LRQSILVTGGCGFIGSNYIRLALQRVANCRLVNLDRLTYAGNPANLKDIESDSRYRFVRGDICDEKLIKRIFVQEGIDTIVHFAAESHVDRSIAGPAEFIRTNIIGTFTLLEAARCYWDSNQKSTGTNHRFLHISTDEVYGSLGDTGFFAETTPYDPHSPYSASKAASDHLVSAYFHTYGLPAIITNCSNNYGPYQFPEKLIPLVISNALEGKSLPVYGDGKNVRDWLYVVDHCEAIMAVLQRGKVGQKYNIGGAGEKQNIEVVRTICRILDDRVGLLPSGRARGELIRFVKDRPGHDRRYAIDAGKIRSQLGWKPSMPFEAGIRETIAWYLANAAWVASVRDGSYKKYYQQAYGERLNIGTE